MTVSANIRLSAQQASDALLIVQRIARKRGIQASAIKLARQGLIGVSEGDSFSYVESFSHGFKIAAQATEGAARKVWQTAYSVCEAFLSGHDDPALVYAMSETRLASLTGSLQSAGMAQATMRIFERKITDRIIVSAI